MIFKYFIILLLVSTCTVCNGQTMQINGNAIQAGDSAISNATITLRTLKDSLLIKGTVTNQNGSFSLENLKTGEYILSISHLSFELYSRQISLTTKDISLINILLIKKDH